MVLQLKNAFFSVSCFLVLACNDNGGDAEIRVPIDGPQYLLDAAPDGEPDVLPPSDAQQDAAPMPCRLNTLFDIEYALIKPNSVDTCLAELPILGGSVAVDNRRVSFSLFGHFSPLDGLRTLKKFGTKQAPYESEPMVTLVCMSGVSDECSYGITVGLVDNIGTGPDVRSSCGPA